MLLINVISTFGGIGGSKGSTYASIIVGFFSENAWLIIGRTFSSKVFGLLSVSSILIVTLGIC